LTTLLLFDIDGTLLSGATRAHAAALHEAIREIHGVDASSERGLVDPAGRTDGEIARLLLLRAGVSAEQIDARADAVAERTARIHARTCEPNLSHTVLPGVAELVSELAAREGVRLGLVTGNYEAVARAKLHAAGIDAPFAGCPGGFGSDSEDRAGLPPIARRRAGRAGVSWPRADTIVIGDTPRDIACARADDLRCLALSTGPGGAEGLDGADWVAAGAAEAGEILRDLSR
jgi:phosphoglycolate phosphatase